MMYYKKNKISIAVIIPVYNCSKYIEQAVNSVLNQPYKNINIIIVDDGSTDGTKEVCDCLERLHENILVIHKENGGVSSARNVGIEHLIKNNAEGYVAFLDADDIWNDFCNEETMNVLEKGYDLIGFQSCLCNEEMTLRSEPLELNGGEYSGGAKSVWIHSTQCFAAMLYSCKLLSKYSIRFNENISYSEDKIFSMQTLYLAERIYLNNKLMYFYRQNGHSLMHTRNIGISYFMPIINAYLESDRNMRRWANDGRGILTEGTILASIYIMDMVDEHFQNFGTKKEIDALLEGNIDYKEILFGRSEGVSIQSNKRYELYRNNPKKYCLKNYVKGVCFFCIRKISYIKYISNLIFVKKYCVKI